MEEVEDEFYCGTNEEINKFDSIMITNALKSDELITDMQEYQMQKAQEKLDRISDVDFIRLWHSKYSLFAVLEELQDRIGCVFTGTAMLRCINRRANNLRKHGVKIQTFTI